MWGRFVTCHSRRQVTNLPHGLLNKASVHPIDATLHGAAFAEIDFQRQFLDACKVHADGHRSADRRQLSGADGDRLAVGEDADASAAPSASAVVQADQRLETTTARRHGVTEAAMAVEADALIVG